MDHCNGYEILDITSKSVKTLGFTGYMAPDDVDYDYSDDDCSDIIEINAPYILSLTIQGDLRLEKLLLRNVCSLVKANFEYTKYKGEEEMLKRFIVELRHVKELTIGDNCLKVQFISFGNFCFCISY